MNSETIECYACSKPFLREIPKDDEAVYLSNLCPSCKSAVEEENRLRDEEKRIEREKLRGEEGIRLSAEIDSDTPPRYRSTDTAHPSFNSRLWAKLKQWRPTEQTPWLGLIGSSGTCKTRCAYLLLREMLMERFNDGGEYSFQAATSYEISAAIMAQYRDNGDPRMSGSCPKIQARRYLDSLATMEILLLDDFGKAKNTPSFTAEIFSILDHRHAHNLVTIWTANSKPEEIVTGMSEDMAGPLAGRLIECSTIINCR